MMTWRNRAACADEGPELFFPIENTDPAHRQADVARAICRRCEVVDSCLTWAIESAQEAGVWGGLSEDERHALKGRNARARRTGSGLLCRPGPAGRESSRWRTSWSARAWTVQYDQLNSAQLWRDLLALQDKLLRLVQAKHPPSRLPVKPLVRQRRPASGQVDTRQHTKHPGFRQVYGRQQTCSTSSARRRGSSRFYIVSSWFRDTIAARGRLANGQIDVEPWQAQRAAILTARGDRK